MLARRIIIMAFRKKRKPPKTFVLVRNKSILAIFWLCYKELESSSRGVTEKIRVLMQVHLQGASTNCCDQTPLEIKGLVARNRKINRKK